MQGTGADQLDDRSEGSIERFLAGKELYGDDFSPDQIKAWFDDEREGYAELGAGDRSAYAYPYHALNMRHGFRHLPSGRVNAAMGIGACYGDEFLPIADRLDHIIIIEPSKTFARTSVGGVPVEYRSPTPLGDIPCADGSVDLVTCFGSLHHIPNVTHVVKEMARCMKTGGHALIREPIVSMGDWRKPRPGLTKRERGIPLPILRRIVANAGLTTVRETLCVTPVVRRLFRAWANSGVLVSLDAAIARLTAWNVRYHGTSRWHAMRPASAYLVVTKL